MRNRFDHLAKQIGREALGASGATVANEEINAETQYADLRHEPDPLRAAERERLGLLGRIASHACLLEIYSQAPNAEDLRACLAKHLVSWQQRTRKTRVENRKRRENGEPLGTAVDPFLWVIAAGVPTRMLTELKPEVRPDWRAGVYFFGGEVLRVGIIVATELPRDRATLLVRLMAAGPLLAGAVKEVAALPPTAYERVIAEPILLSLQSLLGEESMRTPEEEEFIVVMQQTWENARAQGRSEGRAEGRIEGRIEGRVEGRVEGRSEGWVEARANDVLTVLRVRGMEVSDAARERILAQRDPKKLEWWLEKAILATSVDDVIGP